MSTITVGAPVFDSGDAQRLQLAVIDVQLVMALDHGNGMTDRQRAAIQEAERVLLELCRKHTAPRRDLKATFKAG